MNVEQLMRALAEYPGHRDVVVEVIVGGDLGTDHAAVESVALEGIGPDVVLRPAPDEYGTRALIDHALEVREWAEVLAAEIEDPAIDRPGRQRRREWARRLRVIGMTS